MPSIPYLGYENIFFYARNRCRQWAGQKHRHGVAPTGIFENLGEFWENKTQMPIPLGGIVVNKMLSTEIQHKVNRLVRKSIEFAYKNPDSALAFIHKYAQEMDPEIMQKHIALYVNDYSFDLGENGKAAIQTLYKEAANTKGFPKLNDKIFIS